MPSLPFTDIDGHTITLVDVQGIPLGPGSGVDHVQKVRARDEDILLCGFPKCGTNWVWEAITMLLGNISKYSEATKVVHMLELEAFDFKLFDETPSQRVLNTHLPYSMLPADCLKRRCKIVYLRRNPKDVAVSFYNHTKLFTDYAYEGTWNGYVNLFMEGKCEYNDYFEDLKQWDQVMKNNPDHPMLTIYFEDLKQDFMKEMKTMCQFMDIKRDDAFLTSVMEACSFKKLKKEKDEKYKKDFGDILREGGSMFRKGDVGDWKNWFTVAQNELFDEVYAKKMDGLKIPFKYEL